MPQVNSSIIRLPEAFLSLHRQIIRCHSHANSLFDKTDQVSSVGQRSCAQGENPQLRSCPGSLAITSTLDDDAESPRGVRLEYQHCTRLAAWSSWDNRIGLSHAPASVAGH